MSTLIAVPVATQGAYRKDAKVKRSAKTMHEDGSTAFSVVGLVISDVLCVTWRLCAFAVGS
jgi:hypothetical protein